MTFKRIIAFLIVLTLCASLIISCSDKTGNDAATTAAETEPAETEEERILPDLPDIKFDGRTYRFYSWDIEGWRTWDDIDVEDIDGEIINDQVYNRNQTIEANYDVDISFTYEQYLTYETNITKNVRAGEDFTEVLLSMGHDIPRLYAQNIFYNMQNVPYLDFDKPWWDANATESFTLAGYMPFGVSDLILLDKGVTCCVYFNKQIAEDHTLGNLYQYVYDNEWDYAQIISLGKKVTGDINGDSVYDDQDLYGIVGDDSPVFMLFNGGGGRHITKDSEGYPTLSFNTERNVTMIKYYLENIMYDNVLFYNSTGIADTKGSEKMFAEDQALFLFGSIKSSVGLREMETDFGILPIPKYETSQEDYGCAVSVFGTNLISVPLNIFDLDFTGIILEALSAESKYTVLPAFYDIVLKDKFTRDVESTDMLDIILASRVYDVGDFYGLANFPDNFLRITGRLSNLTGIKQTSDVVSFYTSREKMLEKALKDLIKIIDEWKELDVAQ